MGTLLGTRRTLSSGIAAGHRPGATLQVGLSQKLRLDLGGDVLLISLGDSPRASLEALRDDLDALLESEVA